MDNLVGKVWKLDYSLESGSFGEIFLCHNLETHEEAAVKLESVASYTDLLFREAGILKKIEGTPGTPKVLWYGHKPGFHALILQLLGPSLHKLFCLSKKQFSLKTVLMVADQVISRILSLHSHHLLHRDIKPENLLIGLEHNSTLIYLIDYGLAKKYKNKQGHSAYEENLGFIGNQKFCSANALLGIQQSRRDDLEAIGYLLIYFAKGSLPWDDIKATARNDKKEFITKMKTQVTVETLCEGLPEEFSLYMQYVKALGFETKPDYRYLLNLFRGLMQKNEWLYDWDFNWTSHNLYLAAVRKRPSRQKNQYSLEVHTPKASVAPHTHTREDCIIL